MLPGIFGIATLNGLMLLVGGHALSQPSVLVPRLIGGAFTILMAVATAMTLRLTNGNLTNIERTASMGMLLFVSSLCLRV